MNKTLSPRLFGARHQPDLIFALSDLVISNNLSLGVALQPEERL